MPGARSARQVRHAIAEAEAHLRDAVDEGVGAGLSRMDAEQAAVRRMGPPHVLAGRSAGFGRLSWALARGACLGAMLVGAVAMVAIGLSGLFAWLLAASFGGRFVTAPFPPAEAGELLARGNGFH